MFLNMQHKLCGEIPNSQDMAASSVSGSMLCFHLQCHPSVDPQCVLYLHPHQTTSLLTKITFTYLLSSYSFPALHQLNVSNKRPSTGLNGYQGLYNDFLSEVLIFAYQQPNHRINKIQQWLRKAASQFLQCAVQ